MAALNERTWRRAPPAGAAALQAPWGRLLGAVAAHDACHSPTKSERRAVVVCVCDA